MSPFGFFDRLEKLESRSPDAKAIIDGPLQLTYRELVTAVKNFAAVLTREGVHPRDRVALIADNSASYLIAAFATWKLGAVLVTMYASSSESELRYALENSEPSLVIADGKSGPKIASIGFPAPVISLEGRGLLEPSGGVLGSEDLPFGDEELSLICYTSGTTSRPKAVMHSHRGLLAAALSYASVWHLAPTDRTIVCLPMAWAFGLVTTSMATLVSGGTVLVLARTNPEQIVTMVASHKATFLAGVTTMFVKLVDFLSGQDEKPELSSLRLCISGGEPRNETVFDRWNEMTGCPVHDVYAASECFPVVTYDPLLDPVPVRGSSGRVVPDAQMRILDPKGNEVAPGEAGEAYWRGPALFLGYWGDPELTSSTLTDDGWFRTRDLVTRDEHGYVRVVGRLSDMIIRGGSNISPAEVEAVIVQDSAVGEVAVVGVSDPVFGQRAVAVIVARPGRTVVVDELDARCRAQLAGYKVPSEYAVVSALPVNSRTGKIDRRETAARLAAESSVA
jgi:long-chain acyl-CoA synthetase